MCCPVKTHVRHATINFGVSHAAHPASRAEGLFKRVFAAYGCLGVSSSCARLAGPFGAVARSPACLRAIIMVPSQRLLIPSGPTLSPLLELLGNPALVRSGPAYSAAAHRLGCRVPCWRGPLPKVLREPLLFRHAAPFASPVLGQRVRPSILIFP